MQTYEGCPNKLIDSMYLSIRYNIKFNMLSPVLNNDWHLLLQKVYIFTYSVIKYHFDNDRYLIKIKKWYRKITTVHCCPSVKLKQVKRVSHFQELEITISNCGHSPSPGDPSPAVWRPACLRDQPGVLDSPDQMFVCQSSCRDLDPIDAVADPRLAGPECRVDYLLVLSTAK